MATLNLRIRLELPDGQFPKDRPDLPDLATDILAGKVRELGQYTLATAVHGVVLDDDMRKLGNANYVDNELVISTCGVLWRPPPQFLVPRPEGVPLDQAAPTQDEADDLNRDWLAALKAVLEERGYAPGINARINGFSVEFHGQEAPEEVVQEAIREAGRRCGMEVADAA